MLAYPLGLGQFYLRVLESGQRNKFKAFFYLPSFSQYNSENAVECARALKVFTMGNPFFIVQFLKTAAEEGELCYDEDTHHWHMEPALSVRD